MSRRATKPKSTKKAALKARRKSKPSQPEADAAAKETKQSEITQTMPVVVEAAPEAAEPAAETLAAAAAPEPVMETAPVTPVAEKPHVRLAEPKFELYKDKSEKFRFRLKARNGEIIATGEAYNSKEGCLNGIESMKRNAPTAAIVEVEPVVKRVRSTKPRTPRTTRTKKIGM